MLAELAPVHQHEVKLIAVRTRHFTTYKRALATVEDTLFKVLEVCIVKALECCLVIIHIRVVVDNHRRVCYIKVFSRTSAVLHTVYSVLHAYAVVLVVTYITRVCKPCTQSLQRFNPAEVVLQRRLDAHAVARTFAVVARFLK